MRERERGGEGGRKRERERDKERKRENNINQSCEVILKFADGSLFKVVQTGCENYKEQ